MGESGEKADGATCSGPSARRGVCLRLILEAHLLECGGGTLIDHVSCVCVLCVICGAFCACVLRDLSFFCIGLAQSSMWRCMGDDVGSYSGSRGSRTLPSTNARRARGGGRRARGACAHTHTRVCVKNRCVGPRERRENARYVSYLKHRNMTSRGVTASGHAQPSKV